MIPLLKLTGWMPRRIYLPLECKRADKARPLFEEVRDSRVPLAVFWHWSDLNGNVYCKRAGCDFAPAPHPIVSGPLPVDLWKGALQVTNGSGQNDEIEQVAKGLEIRLVLRDPHDAGLLITWNPNLFPNLTDRVGNPGQTRTLVLAKQIKNLDASSVADTGPEVVLQLSLLALKKLSGGASPSVADDHPVQGGLWDLADWPDPGEVAF